MCTSGNYRKTTVVNGQRFVHFDPRNGRPVEHSLLSATVVTPSAAYADAYATVCMVLGPETARHGSTASTSRQAGGRVVHHGRFHRRVQFWATRMRVS